MNECSGISVRQLLENTYTALCQRHSPRKINLKARAEISNGPDYHRLRSGYMNYNEVGLFRFNGKPWAISRGEAGRNYLARSFDSDILALRFEAGEKTEDLIRKELIENIAFSPYFVNSLIIGKSDGRLAGNKKISLGKKILEILESEISRFIAHKAEYSREAVELGTMRPFCTSDAQYKPEFAEFLADSIEKILG
ncbi:hypothetical protein HYT56_01195 [Candidatus Woesearchaeota archaeon]|nr:hypothetical protein [Candidatus Woesearchaeota archaeon]